MRIQLELSNDSVNEIKKLMQESEVKSYSDLFSNSLAILSWAIKETQRGRIIASIDEDKREYSELASPGFASVQRQASQKKAL